MPLARYFSCVGGVLLALLFILDAILPKVPVIERAKGNLPVIHIHSDRKWPDRIVFDTRIKPLVPDQIASGEVTVQASETIADVPPKAGEREAFAMLQSSSATPPHSTGARARELKLQRKHKIAARRVMMRTVWVARQPWFGRSIW